MASGTARDAALAALRKAARDSAQLVQRMEEIKESGRPGAYEAQIILMEATDACGALDQIRFLVGEPGHPILLRKAG